MRAFSTERHALVVVTVVLPTLSVFAVTSSEISPETVAIVLAFVARWPPTRSTGPIRTGFGQEGTPSEGAGAQAGMATAARKAAIRVFMPRHSAGRRLSCLKNEPDEAKDDRVRLTLG